MESVGPQDAVDLELLREQRIGEMKRLAHLGHCLRLPALPFAPSLHPGGTDAVGQTCPLVEDLWVRHYVLSHSLWALSFYRTFQAYFH